MYYRVIKIGLRNILKELGMNLYEKILDSQKKYLDEIGTIDVNTRIYALKKLKSAIKNMKMI